MTTHPDPPSTSAVELADLDLQLRRIEAGLGSEFSRELGQVLRPQLESTRHGDLAHWLETIRAVPELDTVATLDLRAPRAAFAAEEPSIALARAVEELIPWRKGPFQLGPLQLESEWDGAMKWARFAGGVSLAGQRVLDVGAGNGYFTLRAVGAGAHFALGIDPAWLYQAQWRLLQQHFQCARAAMLPLRLSELPIRSGGFDTVMSMGVLYHQRDPLLHLAELRSSLSGNGQLIVESLIIDDASDTCLIPKERYAAMRNVWCIPSLLRLKTWLRSSGFQQLQVLDVSATTSAEQRRTRFMPAPSLADFLDPENPERTREGYPAPLRAMLIAR